MQTPFQHGSRNRHTGNGGNLCWFKLKACPVRNLTVNRICLLVDPLQVLDDTEVSIIRAFGALKGVFQCPIIPQGIGVSPAAVHNVEKGRGLEQSSGSTVSSSHHFFEA